MSNLTSERESPQKPSRLFHYTDAGGLLGILTSSQVWASDIRYLNDSREFEHTSAQLVEALERYCEDPSNHWDRGLPDIGWTVRESLEEASGLVQVFASSFSEVRDDLSQWRGYGGGTGGFALGFDVEVLEGILAEQDFVLAKVNYENTILSDLVAAVVRGAMPPGSYFSNEFTREEGRDLWASISFSRIMTELENLAPRFKHPNFAAEREWRFVYVSQSWSAHEPEPVHPTLPLRFRIGGSLLTPYLSPQIGQGSASPIREILVGPHPHPGLSASAVHSLVEQLGMSECTVSVSESPFRDW